MHALNSDNFHTQELGHLGLVADTIAELDLINLIDRRVPVSESKGAKVTMGERVAAMIFNGLGFVNNRLYLFPEFLALKPCSRLFERNLLPKYFNDDSLGRCLDSISEHGTTKLFTELSFAIGLKKNLLGRSANFDTTTIQLYGEYPQVDELKVKQETNEEEEEDEGFPVPARGYSKSHRHDLKQMVLNLSTTGKSSFPLWMEAQSGNASDQKVLPNAAEKMEQLCCGLKNAPKFIYVGDSAMYSNILKVSKVEWLSRVPESIKEAKKLVESEDKEVAWQSLPEGYSYSIVCSTHKDVKQRWALIFSEQAYARESKTLDKRILKTLEEQKKDWRTLSARKFYCKKDANKAIELQKKKLKYHTATTEIVHIKKHTGKGRPSNITKPTESYKVSFQLEEDKTKIEKTRRTKGRFVLATNVFDEKRLPDSEILKEYKAQSGTEKSFKFIKNATFEIDSVFLKTPRRIEALMMVMTLCLMVYGVAEHNVREALVKRNETVPKPGGKPTSNPSLKRIYQLFFGIQELWVTINGKTTKHVTNVSALIRQILKYFGPRAKAIYLNSG
jgi:transposase